MRDEAVLGLIHSGPCQHSLPVVICPANLGAYCSKDCKVFGKHSIYRHRSRLKCFGSWPAKHAPLVGTLVSLISAGRCRSLRMTFAVQPQPFISQALIPESQPDTAQVRI